MGDGGNVGNSGDPTSDKSESGGIARKIKLVKVTSLVNYTIEVEVTREQAIVIGPFGSTDVDSRNLVLLENHKEKGNLTWAT